MVGAIIITHGTLSRVLMESVEATLGPQSGVITLSNENASLDQIVDRVKPHLGSDPVILFVDFCGGSPYIACRTLLHSLSDCAIVTGVNLPMLFSFFTKRDKLPFAELAKTVESDGHRGIQLVSP